MTFDLTSDQGRYVAVTCCQMTVTAEFLLSLHHESVYFPPKNGVIQENNLAEPLGVRSLKEFRE